MCAPCRRILVRAKGKGCRRVSGSAEHLEPARSGMVVSFPPARQVQRVAAAAALLAGIDNIEVADFCRHLIADDLFRELDALGIAEDEQDEAVGAFFVAVEAEMLRRSWQERESALEG